jgi:hypothetical protein
MVVHIYGLPVDVEPVVEIARRYGLCIRTVRNFEVMEEIEMIEVKQGLYAGDQDKTVFAVPPRR